MSILPGMYSLLLPVTRGGSLQNLAIGGPSKFLAQHAHHLKFEDDIFIRVKYSWTRYL
jgi:hypothetical protein